MQLSGAMTPAQLRQISLHLSLGRIDPKRADERLRKFEDPNDQPPRPEHEQAPRRPMDGP